MQRRLFLLARAAVLLLLLAHLLRIPQLPSQHFVLLIQERTLAALIVQLCRQSCSCRLHPLAQLLL